MNIRYPIYEGVYRILTTYQPAYLFDPRGTKEVNPDRLRMPRGKKGFSVLLFLRTPDQRLDRS